MTTIEPTNGNAVPRHIKVELFGVYAGPELADAPYWKPGVCFLPECSKIFEPAREWQMYCCKACEARGKAEFRSWGHRMALPLLLHRQGKYERHNEAIMARTRAARRFVTVMQSAWAKDRAVRAETAGGL